MKTNQRSFITVNVVVLTIVAGFMGAAHATDKDWNGVADPDRNWTTGANWVGGNAPASGDDVEFLSTGIGIVQVDTPVTVGSIRFLNPGYTLQGDQITIDPTNRWTSYDIYTHTGSNQVDSALKLNGALRITPNGGSKLILNGVISDGTTAGSISTALANSTTRVISLTGANTYTGGTTTHGIRLELGDDAALGTGTWTLETGPATYTYVDVTKDITINNAVSIKTDMIVGLGSALNGTLRLNGPISIDAAGVSIREQDGVAASSINSERLELAGTISDNDNGFELNTQQNSQIMLGSANNITGTVSWVANGTGTGTSSTTDGSAVLAIGNDNALGTGPLQVTQGVNTGRGGQMIADGLDVVIDNDIVLDGNVMLSVGEATGNSVTLTGEFSSTAGSSFNGLRINGGSTLAGTGTIAAGSMNASNSLSHEVRILNSATLDVGNTGNYGTLTIDGDLQFMTSTSIFQVDLKDAAAGIGYDQVLVNGDVRLNSAQLVLNLDAAPLFGSSDLAFILINGGANPVNGIFEGLTNGATVNLGTVLGSPATAQISYFGDSVLGSSTGGNDVVLYNFAGAVIPEPSSVVLMLLGGVATVFFRRHRRSA